MAGKTPNPDDLDERDVPPVAISRETLTEAWRLAGYLWPYRGRFLLAHLFLLLGSLFGLAFPYVAGSLVDGALTKWEAGPSSWWLTINGVAVALVLILLVQAICSFFNSYWFNVVGERALADVRRDLYARLIRLPMAFHTRRRVGELSSRLAADLTQIQDTLIFALPHLIRQVVILVGGVILIALTSLKLTFVMLASFPVLMIAAVLFGRAIRRYSRDAQDELARSNVIVEETLQGIANVKSFTNERFEENRYRQSLDRFLGAILHGSLIRSAFISFIVFGLFGSIILVLWYGAHQVQANQITVGELTRFMLYTLFVGGAVGSFAEIYSQLQRTLGASQRVRELLREQPELDLVGLDLPANLRVRGDIVFENVHFRYPSRPEIAVLRGIDLEVKAGQRVALVGPSGAGKSTLVALLLRFYDPEKGRILLDGLPLVDYPLEELRNQMAVVPQDVLLFGGTLRDNIAYGRPGASEEEIRRAAEMANAAEFIAGFPQGYETLVGERGVQLSGGQRQRVAIARALLRNPALLLLDEATSSLDSENEVLVLQALDRLMEGRTSLIIAHRLSTVRKADRILVLKEGQLVEAGTHEELVRRPDGVYRTLSDLQMQQPESLAVIR